MKIIILISLFFPAFSGKSNSSIIFEINHFKSSFGWPAFPLYLKQDGIPLKEGGRRLRDFYLSLNVENGWIAGQHVNWEDGVSDHPDATSGNHTHCSAFVAAACKKLDIYILRPPEHKQELLANGQFAWLKGSEAAADGWKPVNDNNPYLTAQKLANKGMVVVAICENPDSKKPGHAALVMPAEMSMDKMEEGGPFCIMAATHNFNKISLKNGFKSHLT